MCVVPLMSTGTSRRDCSLSRLFRGLIFFLDDDLSLDVISSRSTVALNAAQRLHFNHIAQWIFHTRSTHFREEAEPWELENGPPSC